MSDSITTLDNAYIEFKNITLFYLEKLYNRKENLIITSEFENRYSMITYLQNIQNIDYTSIGSPPEATKAAPPCNPADKSFPSDSPSETS